MITMASQNFVVTNENVMGTTRYNTDEYNYSIYVMEEYMKKRKIIRGVALAILSILMFFTYKYFTEYSKYKEINIKNIGIIKVPKGWYCDTTKGGLLYFADKAIEEDDCKIYLIQYEVASDDINTKEDVDNGYYLENHDLGNGLRVKDIFIPPYPDNESYIFSNSSYYEHCTLKFNGKSINSYLINFDSGSDNTTFLVLDKSINKEVVEKIAKSYDMTK
ncbi:hypothetical protein [Terrisporobacter petrolearius]|uniref:hypothetical protein n=1 Tax=Terrisporobacter petrolearius TaxID=1460447 RepID=UPI003B00C9E1